MNELELLNEIKKYQFYAVELNLYLDNFPNNEEALNDYNKISKKLDRLIFNYEENFGPLKNFGAAYIENPIAWTSSRWPWENY
jgi:spore coat protein JB